MSDKSVPSAERITIEIIDPRNISLRILYISGFLDSALMIYLKRKNRENINPHEERVMFPGTGFDAFKHPSVQNISFLTAAFCTTIVFLQFVFAH